MRAGDLIVVDFERLFTKGKRRFAIVINHDSLLKSVELAFVDTGYIDTVPIHICDLVRAFAPDPSGSI